MKLRRIAVQYIRNHEKFTCEFSDTTTLIYGKNGAGKTAILEAISIAYRGTSFRGSDREVVRHDQRWYRIDIETDDLPRRITYDARAERPVKQFVIDDKTHGRLPQKLKYPIVLFTPDDLRLIDGSPARRRDYLDAIITQYDTQYGPTLRRYQRALVQRNKLLKQPHATAEQLFSWNVILSETGSYIINARIGFIDYLDGRLGEQYQHIAHINDNAHVAYSHKPLSPQQILGQYESSSTHDFATGTTSVGPHRHDMVFTLRSRPAGDIASRGEVRTIVLAMKFVEAELLLEKSGERPLVLLDDVYGELDKDRRESLAVNFRHHQIVITSTDNITGYSSGLRID